MQPPDDFARLGPNGVGHGDESADMPRIADDDHGLATPSNASASSADWGVSWPRSTT